jgi:hypothetical protein
VLRSVPGSYRDKKVVGIFVLRFRAPLQFKIRLRTNQTPLILAWFPQTAVLYTSASTKTGEVKMLLNNVDALLKLLMLKHCSAGTWKV